MNARGNAMYKLKAHNYNKVIKRVALTANCARIMGKNSSFVILFHCLTECKLSNEM
jgi:hypothetical protein